MLRAKVPAQEALVMCFRDQKVHRGLPTRRQASPQQIPTGLGGLGGMWAPRPCKWHRVSCVSGAQLSHLLSALDHLPALPFCPASSAPPPVPPAACKRTVVTNPSQAPRCIPSHSPAASLNPLPTMVPPACGPRPTQQASLPTHPPCPQGPH